MVSGTFRPFLIKIYLGKEQRIWATRTTANISANVVIGVVRFRFVPAYHHHPRQNSFVGVLLLWLPRRFPLRALLSTVDLLVDRIDKLVHPVILKIRGLIRHHRGWPQQGTEH